MADDRSDVEILDPVIPSKMAQHDDSIWAQYTTSSTTSSPHPSASTILEERRFPETDAPWKKGFPLKAVEITQSVNREEYQYFDMTDAVKRVLREADNTNAFVYDVQFQDLRIERVSLALQGSVIAHTTSLPQL